MAKQDANPPPWHKSMGDGCSGVCDFWWTEACDKHDKAYHEGGTVEDKLVADGKFYDDMCSTPGVGGWMARRGWARIRYTGIRFATYNYPPNHPYRGNEDSRIEAFNWLGSGPG